MPEEVARFDELVGVAILLEPESDHVRVKILKNQDMGEIPDIQMQLDPRTLLLRWR